MAHIPGRTSSRCGRGLARRKEPKPSVFRRHGNCRFCYEVRQTRLRVIRVRYRISLRKWWKCWKFGMPAWSENVHRNHGFCSALHDTSHTDQLCFCIDTFILFSRTNLLFNSTQKIQLILTCADNYSDYLRRMQTNWTCIIFNSKCCYQFIIRKDWFIN